jgi:prepilin-type processing-associated H-X9-DG protein/prepilin-type N-terminal cleavage/methylation domain-containing protein
MRWFVIPGGSTRVTMMAQWNSRGKSCGNSRVNSHAVRAFTLVELLVVIGIIALLISILLPALNAARQQAATVKCLSQMKQLGNAFVMYVNDNKGWLPSCDTCGPLYPQNFTDFNGNPVFRTVSSSPTTLANYVGWIGWVDGTGVPAALSNGTLWKYINNANVYKCPSDSNIYRTRTYSMNSFLNTGSYGSWLTIDQFDIYKMTQIKNAAGTIAFVEESDPRSAQMASTSNAAMTQWNLGGWYENPLICDTIPGPEPTAGYWDDTIASWHRGGGNIAFADGHAEYHRWTDPRTVNMLKNDPTWPNPRYYTPGDVDLTYIRQWICTWGMQRTQ